MLCRVATKSGFDVDLEYQYFATAFDKYIVANNRKSLSKLGNLLLSQRLNLQTYWSKNQEKLMNLAEKCYLVCFIFKNIIKFM